MSELVLKELVEAPEVNATITEYQICSAFWKVQLA